MADNVGSKVTYFLVGLGVGALVGILFAPKSGDETRDFLSKKADEGRDYAQRKARELRERADELIERGKDVAVRQKDSITAAVEGAREAYRREAKWRSGKRIRSRRPWKARARRTGAKQSQAAETDLRSKVVDVPAESRSSRRMAARERDGRGAYAILG